jgi:hypothetical protein
MPTTNKDGTRKKEVMGCVFQGYLSHATVFGAAIVESAVSILLRQVFRYEGMDATIFQGARQAGRDCRSKEIESSRSKYQLEWLQLAGSVVLCNL